MLIGSEKIPENVTSRRRRECAAQRQLSRTPGGIEIGSTKYIQKRPSELTSVPAEADTHFYYRNIGGWQDKFCTCMVTFPREDRRWEFATMRVAIRRSAATGQIDGCAESGE